MQVLIVDDDVASRKLLKNNLITANNNINIIETETLSEALIRFRKESFDVVLVDYCLSQANGIQLLNTLRSEVMFNSAIVMLSNSEHEEFALQCIAAGADDFIVKSDISLGRLRRAIVNAQTRFRLEEKLKKSQKQVQQLAEHQQSFSASNSAWLEHNTDHGSVLVQDEHLIKMNRELKEAKDIADAANVAKSNFLATMSHEIRTPMNGVIGMIDILQRSSLPPEQSKLVATIRESAFDLLHIVNDILDFSKIEAGKLDIEQVPFSLLDVIEKVGDLLDTLALNRNVDLSLFVDPKIPDTLLGDGLRLRQVIINLVNNAIKFSGDTGRVSVRAECLANTKNNVELAIRVSDQGIGMDDDTVAKLFHVFEQADSSTTRRFGGTGLGLAISKSLVDLMGGTINVQSVLGQGSVFTVLLKFKRHQVLEHSKTPARHHAALSPQILCMVVGSNSSMAEDLMVYIQYFGAQVERAITIDSAIEAAAKRKAAQCLIVIDSQDAPGGKANPLDKACAEQLSLDSSNKLQERHLQTRLPDKQLRFIVIERGKRRTGRVYGENLVKIDGNVLHRSYLLEAIQLATGNIVPVANGIQNRWKPEAKKPIEPQQKGKLLVAEDHPVNQKVVLHQLTLLGYQFDIANDGAEALEYLQASDYFLLLTDIHMPKMDGYDLVKALRKIEKQNKKLRMPAIALTANTLKGEEKRCLDAGMDGYLSKPTSIEELKSILDKHLLKHSPEKNRKKSTTEFITQKQDASNQTTSALSSEQTEHTSMPDTPLDINILKSLVGDEPDMINELLHDFLKSASETSSQMRQALDAGQSDLAVDAAHKLKSAARSVGAITLGDLCATIEACGKKGDLQSLEMKIPDFESELLAVNQYLDIACVSNA